MSGEDGYEDSSREPSLGEEAQERQSEKNVQGGHAKFRRAARLSAVQGLYQMEQTGEISKVVIRQFAEHRFGLTREGKGSGIDEAFFADIMDGVILFQSDIDAKISEYLSKNWKLSRLDMTLRAILRAGVYEIMRRPDVPALVIIDQYVSIAADFFDAKEAGFVNGTLDRLARSARTVEFGITGDPI